MYILYVCLGGVLYFFVFLEFKFLNKLITKKIAQKDSQAWWNQSWILESILGLFLSLKECLIYLS